jgi:uncharacterized membrane protein YobD (UPF0266 family)
LATNFKSQNAFTVFDVILELTQVDCTIRVNLLAMLIANTVSKMSCQLNPFVLVTAVPRNRRLLEFTCVLIPVAEIHDSFAFHHTFFKVAFVHTTRVFECALTVVETVHEPASVLIFGVFKFEHALAVELPILEFTLIPVTI